VLLVVVARELIVSLYTTTYLASVPIFVAWSLNFLPSIFAVNAVLRVYAQTRFLIVMNVMRLALVAGLIGWFLAAFGMTGAVLVTLLSTALINAVGVMRIAYLLRVSPAHALPWARLAGIFARAGLAAIPVLALAREVTLTPAVGLVVGSLLYGAGYFGLTYAPAIAERLISPARPDPRTLRTDEL